MRNGTIAFPLHRLIDSLVGVRFAEIQRGEEVDESERDFVEHARVYKITFN